ncbi:hypothetical protein IU452_21615 [Nocardia transvalensis]|nr:hypothetical protein [Nocardia transvalensis]
MLAERGERPCAVVVRVPSIDAASERAAALGWPIDAPQSGYWGALGRQSVEPNLSWTTKVTSMRERAIGSFLNTTLMFGEIEYADVEHATGKNRIDHFAWLVELDNLSRYVKQMSELFETTFEEFRNEPGGNLTMISWDAGLEFAAPLGDSPAADALRAMLAERGEGPVGAIVGVPSIDAASERAAELGWPIDGPQPGYWGALGQQSVEPNLSWTTKVTSMRERVIGDFLNTTLLFGEIEYADVEDATS